MAGDDASSLEVGVDTPLSYWKIPKYDSSCTSVMANYFVMKKNDGPNHPHQTEHADHLVMMITHYYTPL